MTKKQLNVLNELMQDKDFKGKGTLDWLIWRNTCTPKFKIGDYVKITDYACRIYGHQVIDFNAKVIKIMYRHGSKEVQYELEIICKIDGKEDYRTSLFPMESSIHKKAENNTNYLGEQKSKYSSELSPTGVGI